MVNIVFFESEAWERPLLKKAFPKHKLKFVSSPLTARNAAKYKKADIISVFIYSRATKEALDLLPNLKMIATRSTGFDHIDKAECKKRGIVVSTVPFYGENTVAEHTFALILSLSRKVVDSVNATRQGDFDAEGYTGFDLKGKTLGVVGTGHIGQHVIRMAKGFEMNVIAFDVYKDMKAAKKLGFTYATLPTVFKKSDIISLHAPHNDKTHHLINRKNFKTIKKGALIINTARGGLIETEALYRGIKSGHLGGAGLDVLEEEGLIKEEKQLLSKLHDSQILTLLQDHWLMDQENVIVTPHNAFNSVEALQRILDTTIDNMSAFLKKKPINRAI